MTMMPQHSQIKDIDVVAVGLVRLADQHEGAWWDLAEKRILVGGVFWPGIHVMAGILEGLRAQGETAQSKNSHCPMLLMH